MTINDSDLDAIEAIRINHITDSAKEELRVTIAAIEAETPKWLVEECVRIVNAGGTKYDVLGAIMRHTLRREVIAPIARTLVGDQFHDR